MQMIAAIILREHSVRVIWISDGLIKINEPVEYLITSGPFINGFPLCLFLRCEIPASSTLKRCECAREYFETILMRPLGQLSQTGDDVLRTYRLRCRS